MIFKSEKGEALVGFFLRITAICAAMMFTVFVLVSFAGETPPKMFSSPQQAINAAIDAVRNNNQTEFINIFGSQGQELFDSGDAVSDLHGRERFLKAYDEKNKLVAQGDNMVLEIGTEEWPFPIPLVKSGETWFFDTAKGKDELLNRRVGQNELDTIQVCLAIVDAQREYALKDRDGDATPAYAEKFRSDPGQKNGLYWETLEGEPQSPLGEGVAKAREEGYAKNSLSEEPVAFHGYFYRMLKAQGENAPGGKYDYIVNGKMIGGFAVVAYPADYGNSGVMTFIVNHDGIVYQSDLGEDTENIAKEMKEFNPGEGWTKVEDFKS